MAIKSLKKYVLDKAKDAKNYVKKKTKPKAKPKAKPKLSSAEQNKAKVLKGMQATKPKATSVTATKPKATSVTATKPKSTATSVTAKATKVKPRQLDFKKAKISSAAIAGAGAGAGYLGGRSSGSKSAPTKGGGGGSRRTAPKYVEPKGGNIASRTDNSDGSKVGPNMSQVNKPDAKKPERRKGPSGPTMTSMGRPSTGPKPRNKDEKVDLKKRGPSRPSMTGFEKGGKVKGKGLRFEDRDVYKEMAKKDAPAVKRMLEEKPKRPPKGAAYMGMKKGGNVKKYKKGGSIDGCAVKGHTRAKRSK